MPTEATAYVKVEPIAFDYLGEALGVGVGWRRFRGCWLVGSDVYELRFLVHDDDPDNVTLER